MILTHLPLLMILPPFGSCVFISLVAYLVHRTEAVTLMLMTDKKVSRERSSIGVSGIEIPAFCETVTWNGSMERS